MPQSPGSQPTREDIIAAKAGVVFIGLVWTVIWVVVLTICGLITDHWLWTIIVMAPIYAVMSVMFVRRFRMIRTGLDRTPYPVNRSDRR